MVRNQLLDLPTSFATKLRDKALKSLSLASAVAFAPAAQEGPPVAARFNARAWGLASPQAVPKPGQGKDNSDQPDHSVLL